MKHWLCRMIFVVVSVGLMLSRAHAEEFSETHEFQPPLGCGASSATTAEDCMQCHAPDTDGPARATQMMALAADPLTYKTIISSDNKVFAQVPAQTVAPAQSFHHHTWIADYAMTYAYGYYLNGVYTSLDYKWPWGRQNPMYDYDHSFSESGDYQFQIRTIYCGAGESVCGHGWVETTLRWTVTIATDRCTISAVPYLSQKDPRWGGEEYGFAIPHNTIGSAGCALTSSTMALRRYGVNQGVDGSFADPLNLNAWLVANRGYQEGDAIDWTKVEKYSVPAPGGSGLMPQVYYEMSLAETLPAGTTCTYVRNDTGTDRCARINRKIDTALCDGKPPILRVVSLDTGNTHFLVVDGQEDDTVSILDPIKGDTNLLLYSNRYTGYRQFSGTTETTDPTAIVVYLGSPAFLRMSDAAGNVTGWDPDAADIITQIPQSNYLDEGVDAPSWRLYMEHPTQGAYQLQVVGTGSGPFSVEVSSRDRLWMNQATRFEGTVVPGRVYTYDVSYSPEPGGSAVIPATYIFGGFASPLAKDGGGIYRHGRTLPVKFAAVRRDGGNYSDIAARLTLQRLDAGVPVGEAIEPTAAGQANHDGVFRYDPVDDQYIYNLATGPLDLGTWRLDVHLDDGSVESVVIGLK